MGSRVDLAVIGSGGAGFAAAIQATMLGKSVAMIERATFGGTCVNTGCVPSKALIAAGEARHRAADATTRFPGIATERGPVDMAKLVEGTQQLVEQVRAEKYLDVADAYGWRLLRGDASFAGSAGRPCLRVMSPDDGAVTVEAEHYLVATGSSPRIPPIDGLETVDYLTSTTAMELGEVPASLLVLGGGYVALEQAQLFARLGSTVTMLVRSRLMSHEEPEAAAVMRQAFADEGIRVIRRAQAIHIGCDESSGQIVATASVSGLEREFRADRLLVALGRHPLTAGLNLAVVGVRTGDAGEVVIGDRLRSSNPRIWAAGDVTAAPKFVYVAARQARLAVENAFTGADRSVDYTSLPRVIFTGPAIGAVGMTEAVAVAARIPCTCRVLPLSAVPRALVNRDTRGFIKIVADGRTQRILGITAVADDAGELAAAGVHILGKTVTEVAEAWAPYLTMAESIRIAARSFSTDVAMLSCCA